MLKKIIRGNSFLVFFDQAIVSASNFMLTLLLARFLSLDEFGLFSLIWLFTLFFSSIQGAVIISPMLTLGGKREKTGLHRFLYSMFLLEIIYLLVVLIVLLIVYFTPLPFHQKNELEQMLPFFTLATIVFLLNEFFRRYYIIQYRFIFLIVIDIIAYIGVIFLVFIMSKKGILNIKWTFVSIFITFAISNFISYSQAIRIRIRQLYFKYLILKVWNFSKWLLYSALLQLGSGNFFIIMASHIVGNWSVGVIRAAQNIMGVFHIIFISLENILPTKLSRVYKKLGYKSLIYTYKNWVKIGLIASIPLLLIFALFASKIFVLLYGKKYMKFSNLLLGFTIIYLLIYINMLQRYVIRTIEKTKVIFVSYILTTLFSCIFSYPLVKGLGLNGVIIGMIIIQILTYIIFHKQIKEVTK